MKLFCVFMQMFNFSFPNYKSSQLFLKRTLYLHYSNKANMIFLLYLQNIIVYFPNIIKRVGTLYSISMTEMKGNKK